MEKDLIEQFVDSNCVDALSTLVSTLDDNEALTSAVKVSEAFGDSSTFKKAAENLSDEEAKLISSFNHNLVLLIQKTWVEKSDVELKAKVLYQLEELCKKMSQKEYSESYPLFFEILDNVVYLMFGPQSRTKDFDEYALRIDPEFGIFWWYIKSLPKTADYSALKCRATVLLGMYFLANY